jgi:rhamnosyl/mannosyltransferase
METVLAELSRGLVGRGHDVHVLVAGAGATQSGRIDGVQLRRLRSLGSLHSMPLLPGLLGALRDELRSFDPELVHMHLPNPAPGLAWLWLREQRPLVLSHHSDIVRQRALRRLFSPAEQRLLASADAILVSSEALARDSRVLAPHHARVHSIPFGIDAAPFDSVGEADIAAERQEHGRYFLFVGRLVYYKALETLLAALRDSEFRLLVAGEGPMRRRWEGFVAEHGLAAQVRFLGECEESHLRRLLRSCVALVLPSDAASETFGLVQLEAMASRRPVVAARASGGVESVTVDRETGLLVPPKDVMALRQALAMLWCDDGLADRLGEAGRRRLEASFSLAQMLDRTEALYTRVVSGRRMAP